MPPDPETTAVLATLAGITSLETEDDLEALERALARMPALPRPELVVGALLGVLERFPGHDGYGLAWGVVHAVERTPGYEPELVAAVRRRPTAFTLRMLHRLLNGGTARVGEADLLALLEGVAADAALEAPVRELARGYAERRRGPVAPA